MKKNKFVLVAIFVAFILLLSGCGNTKKLSCTLTQNNNTMVMNYVFDGNSLKEATAKYSFDISSYNQTQKEALKKSLNLCDSFKNSATFGANTLSSCNQEITDNYIVANASLDVQKITEKSNNNLSIDDAKKDFEKIGMICEIK